MGHPATDSLPRAALVLLVEDDPSGREMYSDFLSSVGFRVAQAHNGLQALEKAIALVPDIIVTDLGLPGIDGFELCRRIKEHERTRNVPLLAITGYERFGYVDRAIKAGCDGVLTKPCLPDRLLDEIKRVMAPRSGAPA
jgi:two-component system, cell cycle response regulator DivK